MVLARNGHSSPVHAPVNPREHAASAIACDLAADVVRTFGEVRLRVFGTSMLPSILPGDLISVQRAVVSEVSSGEVVVYAREGRIFAHRAVVRTGSPQQSFLITRGDLLRYNDPPVSSSELLGKVISVQRGGRQVKLTSRPGGLAYAFIRLLRNSERATYSYVKLASLWGILAARTFSRRRKNGGFGAGAKVKDPGTANAATHKFDKQFDAQVRPLEAEGALKCQG